MRTKRQKVIKLTRKQLREMVLKEVGDSYVGGRGSIADVFATRRRVADTVNGFLWDHMLQHDLSGAGYAQISDVVGHLGQRITALILRELEAIRELGAEWE